jgi:hypothetical protein
MKIKKVIREYKNHITKELEKQETNKITVELADVKVNSCISDEMLEANGDLLFVIEMIEESFNRVVRSCIPKDDTLAGYGDD